MAQYQYRALNEAGDRRSAYLEDAELDELPEATPAP